MARLAPLFATLSLLVLPAAAHAGPAPKAPAKAPKVKPLKDWTKFTSGPCPVVKALTDGTGLCAVGTARSGPNGREAATLEARTELARLVQWSIDRKADPAAKKPTHVDLVLEGTEAVRFKEARKQVYALVRLSPEGAAKASATSAP